VPEFWCSGEYRETAQREGSSGTGPGYQYAYAAVSPVDGIMDSLILPEVNASVFELFLNEVSSRHLPE